MGPACGGSRVMPGENEHMTTPPRLTIAPLALAAVTLALLAGCVPTPEATPSASPTPTASETPTATPEPVETQISTPVDATCDQLVSADTLYIYNPNFAAIDDYSPAAGSDAETAVADDGIACRWQNLSSGESIVLSVASLDDATLTTLKNDAFAASEPVPTYGDEAYFSVENGVGTAIVFQGSFWLVATSPFFFEPGDASEIVDSALSALA